MNVVVVMEVRKSFRRSAHLEHKIQHAPQGGVAAIPSQSPRGWFRDISGTIATPQRDLRDRHAELSGVGAPAEGRNHIGMV